MNAAMILCAGFGTRLNELTRNCPKPMLEISDKPILEYTIRHLQSLGYHDIIINLHYLPEKIKDYFGNGNKFGVNIVYSYEENTLGTAGAVKKVEKLLSLYDDFLVIYGDIVTNQNLNDLLNFHKSKKSVASIILHERAKSNSIVEMNKDNKIILFIERPENEFVNKKQNWVNSGLYCFNKKIFEYIPDNKYCDFPKDIFPELIRENNLFGFPLTGYRCAIDSPERYEKAKDDFKQKAFYFNFKL